MSKMKPLYREDSIDIKGVFRQAPVLAEVATTTHLLFYPLSSIIIIQRSGKPTRIPNRIEAGS